MKLAKRLMMQKYVTDPYWSSTSLCINASGDDGSTSIVDAKGNSLALYGDTQIDTSLGYPVIQFDGDGDTISATNSTALTLGSGDFTIEAMVYPESFALAGGTANRAICGKGTGTTTGFALLLNTSGNVLWYNSATRLTTTSPLLLNTLQHLAFTYTGGVLRAFIGGFFVGSATISLNISSTSNLFIGSSLVNNGWFLGKIPAIRITKGIARWTTAFTPPSFPFPTS